MAKKRAPRTMGSVLQQRGTVSERIQTIAGAMEQPAPAPKQKPKKRVADERITIRVTRAEADLWRSVAFEERSSLSHLIGEAVGREIQRREDERGKPYPEKLPRGRELPRGPRFKGSA